VGLFFYIVSISSFKKKMIKTKVDLKKFSKIVFFTGAGMSAESGIPTYRGKGGVWDEYKWEDYACQYAFKNNPEKVLDFHEKRRKESLKSKPHIGHNIITDIQKRKRETWIITQNIDGIHQRAGANRICELHGSLWRLRCESEQKLFFDNKDAVYQARKCSCGLWLRPDIIWFQDELNKKVVLSAVDIISQCELFISVGTSGKVWPAAGYPKLAKSNGAYCIEINTEETSISHIYDQFIKKRASQGLVDLF